MSMTAEVPSLLDPWSSAWDDRPVAALDAIEASLHRGDTSCALVLIRSIRRRLRESDPMETAERFRLTDRELAALVLLPDATLSQKDIARALGITGNTLKTHLRSIYQKLGAHSRAEAIELGGLSRAVAIA
jgi:LuxR family maltose regulon positive regulatory protein